MIERMEGGEILSLKHVARICNVHVATVWRWVLKGVRRQRLPSIFVGGQRRVLRADLEAFLAALNQRPRGSNTNAPAKAKKRNDDIDALLEREGL